MFIDALGNTPDHARRTLFGALVGSLGVDSLAITSALLLRRAVSPKDDVKQQQSAPVAAAASEDEAHSVRVEFVHQTVHYWGAKAQASRVWRKLGIGLPVVFLGVWVGSILCFFSSVFYFILFIFASLWSFGFVKLFVVRNPGAVRALLRANIVLFSRIFSVALPSSFDRGDCFDPFAVATTEQEAQDMTLKHSLKNRHLSHS